MYVYINSCLSVSCQVLEGKNNSVGMSCLCGDLHHSVELSQRLVE